LMLSPKAAQRSSATSLTLDQHHGCAFTPLMPSRPIKQAALLQPVSYLVGQVRLT
jgi:hypothetical protein